ncbi:hypothetical protein [Desulfovibrio ferrophilus]|uniref:Uncharacterized protein n=1 Tax=Desulfovibrio ferrophilus TaxID=241368 RepID=A0A2Z6AX68_9BACT|nr:hypothetical protein [Desulfovibrio ferrophilus]BBD07852.1 putative uncharacterized protein [Desulfovibrio ferrophilus]
MADKKKPITPVKPAGMEIICFYTCPFCERDVPMMAPTQPTMARCDSCQNNFPVVPVDERGIRFFKMMTANGRAAVDSDFL